MIFFSKTFNKAEFISYILHKNLQGKPILSHLDFCRNVCMILRRKQSNATETKTHLMRCLGITDDLNLNTSTQVR